MPILTEKEKQIQEQKRFFSLKNKPKPFQSELNDFMKFHHRRKAWLRYRKEFIKKLKREGIEWDGYSY